MWPALIPRSISMRTIIKSELAATSPFSGSNRYSLSDFRALAIRTFFAHPFAWVTFKLGLLPPYWFASCRSFREPVGNPEYIQNGVFLITMVVISGLGLVDLVRLRFGSLAMHSMALVASTVATVLALHFETRYFFIPKVGSLILALLMIVESIRVSRPNASPSAIDGRENLRQIIGLSALDDRRTP